MITSKQLYGWGWFFNLFLSDIAASDLSVSSNLEKEDSYWKFYQGL